MVSNIKRTSDTILVEKVTRLSPQIQKANTFFFPFFFQLSSVAKYCTRTVALFLLSVAVLELYLEIKNTLCF